MIATETNPSVVRMGDMERAGAAGEDNGTVMDKLLALRASLIAKMEANRWLGLFLLRVAVGLIFVSTGWGKVHSIPNVTQFFTELGIPAPGVNAVFVSWTELLGGSALVLGAFSRLAAIPLAASMVVAIATAKRAEIKGFFSLVSFEEFTYLLILIAIVILGSGKLSVDHALEKRLKK